MKTFFAILSSPFKFIFFYICLMMWSIIVAAKLCRKTVSPNILWKIIWFDNQNRDQYGDRNRKLPRPRFEGPGSGYKDYGIQHHHRRY